MKNVNEIIRKWYSRLEVPEKYDDAFRQALQTIEIGEDTTIEKADLSSTDGARNFLTFLYLCEDAERKFRERGIGQAIITDTLKDIVNQADRYYGFGKKFYLGELGWLKHHVSAELFKLGRLQFAFGKAEHASEKYDLKAGDPVLEVHIDSNGPLTPEACDSSFAQAEVFFHEHFPEFDYKFYTCHSWILGSNVADIVREGSNLRAFRKRFDVIYEESCDDILKYVFRWNTTRETAGLEPAVSSFGKAVQQQAAADRIFYIGYGVISHEEYQKKYGKERIR